MLTTLAKLDNPSNPITITISYRNDDYDGSGALKFTSPCFYVNYYTFNIRDAANFLRIDMVIPDDILNEINNYIKTKNIKVPDIRVTVFSPQKDVSPNIFVFSSPVAPVAYSEPSRPTPNFHSFFISSATFSLSRWSERKEEEWSHYMGEVKKHFHGFREDPYEIKFSENEDAINYGLASIKKLQDQENIHVEEPKQATFQQTLKSAFKSFTERNAKQNSEAENRNAENALPTDDAINLVNLSSLKKLTGSLNPTEDLNKLIGLASVKEEVERFYAISKFNREMGNFSEVQSMHMCFMGNPGTGKTTVARIMTGILYEMGCIKKNQCLEINALEMCGNYVGQTGQITAKIINEAKGGVLFVDEAYSLAFGSTSFGQEAVSVLLKEMEDNRDNLVVIFAGYAGPMSKFLDMNSGFRSRINHYFNFEDYSLNEMLDMVAMLLHNRRLTIDREAMSAVVAVIEEAIKKENFSNGRFARNLIEKIEDEHTIHVPFNVPYNKLNEEGKKRFDTILLEDIPHDIYRIN